MTSCTLSSSTGAHDRQPTVSITSAASEGERSAAYGAPRWPPDAARRADSRPSTPTAVVSQFLARGSGAHQASAAPPCSPPPSPSGPPSARSAPPPSAQTRRERHHERMTLVFKHMQYRLQAWSETHALQLRFHRHRHRPLLSASSRSDLDENELHESELWLSSPLSLRLMAFSNLILAHRLILITAKWWQSAR